MTKPSSVICEERMKFVPRMYTKCVLDVRCKGLYCLPVAKRPVKLDSEIEKLRKEGFEVSRKGEYLTRTFRVECQVLETFLSLHEKLGIKLQDAVTEALHLWCDKHSGKTKT
jgi:hypothetical protein